MLIAEDLALLGRNPDGTESVPWTEDFLGWGLVAGLLAELIGRGVAVVDHGQVRVAAGAPTGHPVLDRTAQVLNGLRRTAVAPRLIDDLSREVRGHEVRDHLVAQGVLQLHEEGRFLGVRRYRIVQPALRDAAIERCRRALVTEGAIDPQVAVLMRLAAICEVDRPVLEGGPDPQVMRRRMLHATDRAALTPPVAAGIDGVAGALAEKARTHQVGEQPLTWD